MSRKLLEAVAQLQPAIDVLHELNARAMERVENEHYGIVFERWLLPNGLSAIAFGTPFTRDVFVESDGESLSDSLAALRRRAAQ